MDIFHYKINYVKSNLSKCGDLFWVLEVWVLCVCVCVSWNLLCKEFLLPLTPFSHPPQFKIMNTMYICISVKGL